MKMQVITPLETCLAENPDPADHWLTCLYCDRFFHLSSVEKDATGLPSCPFPDCYGGGFDITLVYWDTTREPDDPRWPATAAELRHGMKAPDYESFAEARLEEHILAIERALEASPEYRELAGRAPRYVRPFLQMMSDLCCDLTEADEPTFMDDIARELVPDLPVWARTADPAEAPRMLDELRAVFAFGERTGWLSDARDWQTVVADDTMAAAFTHTMRTDRRLRRQRRAIERQRRTEARHGERKKSPKRRPQGATP